jgi:ABC-type glycerol-3-phosphate transport system substrate-binding protein
MMRSDLMHRLAPIVLLLCLLLFACRNEGNGPAVSGVEATLTLAVPDGTSERYRALAEAFMAENEGITVHVESMNRLIDDPNTARALAQAADVFPALYAFGGDWQSLTLDLSPFVEAEHLNTDDFPAGLLYAADGTVRYLPSGLDPHFVLYNKALFDNAGLSYPTPAWTWEEFVALATQLTQRHGDFTAQYGWADGLQANGLIGAGLAGPLADYTTTPPTPRLADEDVVLAVNRYVSLFGETGVAPTPQSTATAYSQSLNLVRERRVAMWLTSYSFLSSHGGLDVGVLPLPITNNQDDRRLYVSSYGFAASAATQHPAQAWQLIEYLSRQQPFVDNTIPARASVRQATDFWDDINPEVAAVVETYLSASFELPYATTRQALGRAVVSALFEDVAVAEVLAREETAVRQGLVSEEEPLAAVVSAVHSGDTPITRILFITDGWHTHRHRVLVKAFEEENPDLRLDLASPYWTPFSNIAFRNLDRAHTGQRADCFLYTPLTEDQTAQVLSLDALLELEPDLARDDFYPIAWNAFLHDGALIGLPYQFRLPHIGYDTAVFDAAGLPYPEAGWTLEEFLETAVALTGGEGRQRQYGYVPYQGEMIDAWIFLHAFGVDLIDSSVEPATANFDTPSIAEALRWYIALSETYGVKPVYRTNMYDLAGLGRSSEMLAERRSLFAARRGAMWQDDGSESEGAYRKPTAAIEERQYTTFPVSAGVGATLPVEATGLFISATTEQRQACWRWLTFLLDHDPGMGIPARRTVAGSEEFRLRAGPATGPMLQSAEQFSQHQIAIPPEWMNLQSWYSVALTRALEENITAEEALSLTQAEFEQYRHCVIEDELYRLTDAIARLRCAAAASPYVFLTEE